MSDNLLLCRSVLYMPGSKDRALEKATSLPADALIFDLEDAVAPTEKDVARECVVNTLSSRDYGHRLRIVRINGLETQWGEEDMRAVCSAQPDVILIPKVNDAQSVLKAEHLFNAFGGVASIKLWAMMETPLSILNAQSIAASTPKLRGFVMGTNDLIKDMNARDTPDRVAVLPALSLCVLAARAYGLVCIDGVHNALDDEAGLSAVCSQGRDMGFDGKSLIHPKQLEITNRIFAPSQEEVEMASEYVKAFEQAKAEGLGVAVVNGRIVENLHVEQAQRLLSLDKQIKERSVL